MSPCIYILNKNKHDIILVKLVVMLPFRVVALHNKLYCSKLIG